MNIIDSSCWLEFFAGSKVGKEIASIIGDLENLVVPAIVLYEVFKKLLVEVDEDKAIMAIAHMKLGKVVEIDADLAITAAKVGKDYKLAMADSLIYATSLKYDCTLWTQDRHFKDLLRVKYYEKEPS
ncbi:MAG: twitching motility protein PilT [Spirochaetes bacterium GWD1_61_31]|nr:MAG: twitching motility protein PilT [Spirochaetes bacterium GWB1_60_80]OHD30474.1 MAG: twitching motility protein PilT [Spirochaetes bacterium GWC1_61_12]OHD41276.1 MAG: twitching motility protein PilT [Spirochaetes bacterium GWD1_61_31]OHD44426.1 MAG: twitching motility protein PilT [Spirochaetes bacterium GWE1_60_18]OHD60840.1 MAG: twitching motility protein PilT [Spirochaetes bacterium GWF1_60_12]HAP43802.1 VapC toxin family PIN domain ribonuclease [Spirochaetaceae bacterium]